MSLLEVKDLHVRVADKPILKGLNLTLEAGSVHAIMGPNGSGKSTLAAVLAGKPGYEIESGEIYYQRRAPERRGTGTARQQGVFLAFQYPVEIPGVSNMEFLKAAMDNLARRSRREEAPNTVEFMKTRPRHRRRPRSESGVPQARRQRRLLRWRKETQRDSAAAAAGSARSPCSTKRIRAWTSTRCRSSPNGVKRLPRRIRTTACC